MRCLFRFAQSTNWLAALAVRFASDARCRHRESGAVVSERGLHGLNQITGISTISGTSGFGRRAGLQSLPKI
jgi:hypothetical protein